jgi:hypothetical protein
MREGRGGAYLAELKYHKPIRVEMGGATEGVAE